MQRDQGPRILPVHSAAEGQRLDNFLLRHLRGIPRSLVYRLVRKGAVRVNGRRAKAETRVSAGDEVRVPALDTAPATDQPRVPEGVLRLLRKAVLFEDEDYLVLDKPAGLAVHGGSGLAFGLIEAMRMLRPGDSLELGHRLDRDTSGCLVLTKSRRGLQALHAGLRAGDVEKRYLALVAGHWDRGNHRCDLPIAPGRDSAGKRRMLAESDDDGGRPATSLFTPLEVYPGFTLMDVNIGTGRTHQIRVHAAALGHPIAGDHTYGEAESNRLVRAAGLRRIFLHAQAIRFPNWNGELQLHATPLPTDLQQVLTTLGGGRR